VACQAIESVRLDDQYGAITERTTLSSNTVCTRRRTRKRTKYQVSVHNRVRISVIRGYFVHLYVMTSNDMGLWESLENWMPHLFVVAGVLSLVAAANYGVTQLFDSISFNSWVGLTVLLARVASLLGVAGLSARILAKSSRVGRLSRAVVVLALVSTVALLTSAVLKNFGIEPPLQAVFGLGTVALSILTYSLFGAAILRTGAYTRLVGGLLLGATVALLFGLFGRAVLPIGVVGTVAEFGLFVTHVAIGYRLLHGSTPGDRAELTPESVAE
jgi:hypothetical protein